MTEQTDNTSLAQQIGEQPIQELYTSFLQKLSSLPLYRLSLPSDSPQETTRQITPETFPFDHYQTLISYLADYLKSLQQSQFNPEPLIRLTETLEGFGFYNRKIAEEKFPPKNEEERLFLLQYGINKRYLEELIKGLDEFLSPEQKQQIEKQKKDFKT